MREHSSKWINRYLVTYLNDLRLETTILINGASIVDVVKYFQEDTNNKYEVVKVEINKPKIKI